MAQRYLAAHPPRGLFADADERAAARSRRLLTVPGYAVGLVLWLALLPLVVPLAALVDLIRRSHGVALRSAAMVTLYLGCEVLGIAIASAIWLWARTVGLDETRWKELHFRLEAWWGSTLLRGVVRLFGLRLEVEDEADLSRGPYLLLLRHLSSGDTLLASELVSRRHGLRLRYVLKHELLWDPCLDIVGHRVPNVFVRRDGADSTRELEQVSAVASELGPREGVLIYPEGTRFSSEKRDRIRARLERERDGRRLAYARSLENVLPPRSGGTLALLEASPDADVVVCTHTGFEGAASLSTLWRGELVGSVIRVHFTRIARSEIPVERAARRAWLRDVWSEFDRRVALQRASDPPARA